jgi:hypothetical protein
MRFFMAKNFDVAQPDAGYARLEGIVTTAGYISGRTRACSKMKNPNGALIVRRRRSLRKNCIPLNRDWDVLEGENRGRNFDLILPAKAGGRQSCSAFLGPHGLVPILMFH